MIKNALYIAPFLVWTVLMTVLPASAESYALRAAVAAILSVVLLVALRARGESLAMVSLPDGFNRPAMVAYRVGLGLLVGIVAAFVWILPEGSETYRTWLVWPIGELGMASAQSPYDPAVCGWGLTMAKLVGSAFVIAPIEELFFRGFLYHWLLGAPAGWCRTEKYFRFELSPFLITVGLFACEHDRFAVATVVGALYGVVMLRGSLLSAIVAHVTTNLILAIYVITCGKWGFW